VCVWTVADGVGTCEPLGVPVTALSFASDRLLVAGGSDGTIRAWNPVTWQQLATVHHDSEVTSIAVTPDGSHIAAGAVSGVVRVWTIDGQAEVARVDHRGRVSGVTFVSDGRYLLTASVDRTAMLSWWLAADLASEACARLGPGRDSAAAAPGVVIDRASLCGTALGSAFGTAALRPLIPN
jgi:WD40 repeat protein